jgi:REP element-mobilizing transposase RayT
MARRPRFDAPDTWHHVMNRALARRTLFESERDLRMFLAFLAREVRRGRIELHAFCLLPTHFHLLVRSLTGQLSRALRSVQNAYSRWFNRSRRRDGPLFRGRFLSKEIDSLRYRRNVVTYLHDNALDAGLASLPHLYPPSSAFHLVQPAPPPWLATAWIAQELALRGRGDSPAQRLASAFPSRIDPDFRSWIERQLHSRLPKELEEDSLRFAGSPRVLRWMFRKARLADGTRPFRPVCPAGAVARAVADARTRLGSLAGRFRHKARGAWHALRAGLLRLLAGCTHREIGLRSARHPSTSCRDVQEHLELMRTSPAYERLASRLASAILAAARTA